MKKGNETLGLRRTRLFIAVLGVAVLFAGCGKATSRDSGGDVPPVARLDVGNLPALGDPLPPLDGGRVEISPPRDWVVAPRSNRYLVRFQSGPGNPYPTVIVTVEDCEQFKNIDARNVGAFAKFVAAELAAKNVKSRITPGQIGELVGVMYTGRARVKDALGGIVERVFFDTVVGGRRYKFELRSPPETVSLAEPYLLVIVRGTNISVAEELEESLAGPEEEMPPGGSETQLTSTESSAAPKEVAAKEAKAKKSAKEPASTSADSPKVAQQQTTQSAPSSSPETPSGGVSASTPSAEQLGVGASSPAGPPKSEQAERGETGKKKSAEDLLKEVDKLLQ